MNVSSMGNGRGTSGEIARDSFDPGNLLHIVSASKAGGLNDVPFPDYDSSMGSWSEKVMVRIGKVKGSDGAGFVTH